MSRATMPGALLGLWLAASAGAQDAGGDKEYEALSLEYARAEEAFRRTLEAAKGPEEHFRLWSERHPGKAFIPRFRELARRSGGSEAGADALLWVVRVGRQVANLEAVAEAAGALVGAHPESPQVEALVVSLMDARDEGGRMKLPALFARVSEAAPSARVRATAAFARARRLMDGLDGPPSPAGARAAFEKLRADFPKSPYAEPAGRFIFELDRLQVGMAAPDVDAVDSDGARFKLSDYRGRVVVMLFWGFW